MIIDLLKVPEHMESSHFLQTLNGLLWYGDTDPQVRKFYTEMSSVLNLPGRSEHKDDMIRDVLFKKIKAATHRDIRDIVSRLKVEERRFQDKDPSHKFTLENLVKELEHWANTSLRESLEDAQRVTAMRSMADAAIAYSQNPLEREGDVDIFNVPREFVSPSYFERTKGRNAAMINHSPGSNPADVAPAPPSSVAESLDSRLCEIGKKICLYHEAKLLDDNGKARGCEHRDRCKFEHNSKPVVTSEELRRIRKFFRQNAKDSTKAVNYCWGYSKGKCDNKRGPCPFPHLSKEEVKERAIELGL